MGQTKPCFIYRLIALASMEEAIYKRQITKLSMSKRVVDEQQIERHFKRNDLEELYSTTNIEPVFNAHQHESPNDHILSNLLSKFKDVIHNYQLHDSLLQDRGDKNLSSEEQQLAWNEYKNETPREMAFKNAIHFPALQLGNVFT